MPINQTVPSVARMELESSKKKNDFNFEVRTESTRRDSSWIGI